MFNGDIITKINKENAGVSIITVTNRPNFMNKVFENYERQNYEKKELIIILNKNCINLEKWKKQTLKYKNVKVYQLDEKLTLSECKNFGVEKSNFEFITHFDDDDYYAPNYLRNSIRIFEYVDADIVGKSTFYVYFNKKNILALCRSNKENRYVEHVADSSMIIKRKIFDIIKFPKLPRGADRQFQKYCIKKGFKIYSADRFNYVVHRSGSIDKHQWKVEDEKLLKWCKIVKRNIKKYTRYVNV